MFDMTSDEYVNVRMPKSEYDKLRQTRDEMSKKPDYSWVGHLALGAFVGFLIGVAAAAIEEDEEEDEN